MAILSKISRGLAAYLIDQGCGSINDILQYRSVADKELPNTVIDFATIGNEEIPNIPDTRVTVAIRIRSSAVAAEGETNPDAPWIAHNQRIDSHYAALNQVNPDDIDLEATRVAINAAARSMAVAVDDSPEAIQFAKNNADMADFTITEYHFVGPGIGRADEDGTYWEDVLLVSVLACENNVD